MPIKRMYSKRKANIAAFRGCYFGCTYCAFRNSLKRSACLKCRDFEPHEHLESFNKTPPRTSESEGDFVTLGMNGDIAFAPDTWFLKAVEYCERWYDRTFMVQSKHPQMLARWNWPSNVVLGTTIETNRTNIWTADEPLNCRIDYADLSGAPNPVIRKETLITHDRDVAVTIEPVLDFELYVLLNWMIELQPKIIWIGYDSRPERNKLPEPELAKTEELIDRLRENHLRVEEKLLRKAWWEE